MLTLAVFGTDTLRSYLKRLSLRSGTIIPLNSSTAPSQAATKLNLDTVLNNFAKLNYLEKAPNPHMQTGAVPGTQANAQRSQRNQARIDALDQATGLGLGDPLIEWRWGARADAEIGELNIAKFIETFFMEADANEARTNKLKTTLAKNLERSAGGLLQPATGMKAPKPAKA